MTAYGAIDSAIESIRQGAYHYLTKPFKLDELALFLERALDERARPARGRGAARGAARAARAARASSRRARRCATCFDVVERVARVRRRPC